MWNSGLDEAQAGIKIAGRNSNNLKYADDTTLMAESEEELKSFLMKVKEEKEKSGLKLIPNNNEELCQKRNFNKSLNKEGLQKGRTTTTTKNHSTFRKLRSWYLVPSRHGK